MRQIDMKLQTKLAISRDFLSRFCSQNLFISHISEPQLRQLGMPTELKKGVVTLMQHYTVCKEGDRLTSEQARILKLLGHQQAKFKLNMIALWSREEGDFKMLREDFEPTEMEEDEENDDDNELTLEDSE